MMNNYRDIIENNENLISQLSSLIETKNTELENLKSQEQTKEIKEEIKNIKKEIASLKKEKTEKTKEYKEAIKTFDSEQKKMLLPIQEFFTYLDSKSNFVSIMRETGKNINQYVLYEKNDKIFVYPKDDELPITVYVVFEYEDKENNFYQWLKQLNCPVVFTSDDLKLFKKLSISSGKKGTKIIIENVEFDESKYCIYGHFYIDGNEDIGFEKELLASPESSEFDSISDGKEFEIENLSENNNLALVIKNPEDENVLLELVEDMIFVLQDNAKYYIEYTVLTEDGIAIVELISKSNDSFFEIHQRMSTVLY